MEVEITYSSKEDVEVSENKIHVGIASIGKSHIPMTRFSLLLDTGAFITLISKERAEENGYKIYEESGCIISGFSEKGLICDLRTIPTVVFCGFRIEDAVVATPHDNGIPITEVLGMNVLENFSFGLDFTKSEIYMAIRKDTISQKPKYQ
jgi:hypothetical protein